MRNSGDTARLGGRSEFCVLSSGEFRGHRAAREARSGFNVLSSAFSVLRSAFCGITTADLTLPDVASRPSAAEVRTRPEAGVRAGNSGDTTQLIFAYRWQSQAIPPLRP